MATIYHRLRPSDRVRLAMRRISRDRYLMPADVHRIGLALSNCASHGMRCHVYKYAIPVTCEVVGMINGMPPAFVDDKCYSAVLSAVRSMEKQKKGDIETLIHIIKAVSHQNIFWRSR